MRIVEINKEYRKFDIDWFINFINSFDGKYLVKFDTLISEGKVAVVNDGTKGELEEVLKAAFPRDKTDVNSVSQHWEYYTQHERYSKAWVTAFATSLPTQSVKEFYKQLKEKMDNRFPFKLTEKDAKRIVNIACSSWKPKLSEKWGVKLLEKGYVTIKEPFYKEMRKACTDEQHKLFDEIFGKDAEKFKMGDWVYIGKETDTWKSVVKLTKDIEDVFGYAINKQGDEVPFAVGYISRKATPEEIAKAQCPYEDGELCWVKNEVYKEWRLRYATGKVYENTPEFYRSQRKNIGHGSVTYNYHKSAKGIELPKD